MLRLKIAIISGIMCIISSAGLIAQVPDSIRFSHESPADLNLSANMDSMLRLWYVDKYVNVENLSQLDSLQSDSVHTNIPDSVYIARLKRIPSAVDLSYNEVVRRYIEVYTVKRRASVEVMLGLHYVVRVQCPQLFDGGQVLGLHHRFKLADVVGVSDNEFDCVYVCCLWRQGIMWDEREKLSRACSHLCSCRRNNLNTRPI